MAHLSAIVPVYFGDDFFGLVTYLFFFLSIISVRVESKTLEVGNCCFFPSLFIRIFMGGGGGARGFECLICGFIFLRK